MVSLMWRSALVLALLFGLLFAVGLMVIVYFGLPSWLAVIFSFGILLLQYLLGPFILERIYRIRWVELRDVDPALADFVAKVCHQKNIPVPRFGLIEDGMPNAFTYGHYPGNARLVVTRGLMHLLEPEEVQAVVAHELGHIVHWDFVVMTMAQAVPLVLYTLYITTRRLDRGRGRGRENAAGVAATVGLISYVTYILSQYAVLLLSRVREYFADEFASQVTGDPDRLATALVKVAYGLAATAKESKDSRRERALMANRALGIFDHKIATPLALTSAGLGKVTAATMKETMKWDLWNPWAWLYELRSTHPLPAKRIRALEQQTVALGRPSRFSFRMEKPESYWDEFLVDVVVHFLPLLGFVAGGMLAVASYMVAGWVVGAVGLFLLIGGSVWFAQRQFTYPPGLEAPLHIRDLVSQVKVSGVRPIPGTLRGKIIGRGIPGLFYSEDLVLQDDTGFIVLDYRQPLRILEVLFGWLKADDLIGQTGQAEGWYRRAPRPVFELRRLTLDDGRIINSYFYLFVQGIVYTCILVGLAALVLELVVPFLIFP